MHTSFNADSYLYFSSALEPLLQRALYDFICFSNFNLEQYEECDIFYDPTGSQWPCAIKSFIL